MGAVPQHAFFLVAHAAPSAEGYHQPQLTYSPWSPSIFIVPVVTYWAFFQFL